MIWTFSFAICRYYGLELPIYRDTSRIIHLYRPKATELCHAFYRTFQHNLLDKQQNCFFCHSLGATPRIITRRAPVKRADPFSHSWVAVRLALWSPVFVFDSKAYNSLCRLATSELLKLGNGDLRENALTSIKLHSLSDHLWQDILNHGSPYSYDAQRAERAHKGPEGLYKLTNKQHCRHAYMKTMTRKHEVNISTLVSHLWSPL